MTAYWTDSHCPVTASVWRENEDYNQGEDAQVEDSARCIACGRFMRQGFDRCITCFRNDRYPRIKA